MKKIALFSVILGAICATTYAMADGEEFEAVCDPVTQICYEIPRRGPIVGGCTDRTINKSCPQANKYQKNATKTKCIWVKRTSKSPKEPSCAATECKDGYLLWLSKDKTGEYRSMGVCHTEKFAADSCENGCKNCNPDEKCVPNLVPTPETKKPDGAYADCICENTASQPNPIPVPVVEEPAKECTYYFSGTIKCDGKKVTISKTKSVTVPCVDDVVENLTDEMFENDTGELRQIRDELCEGVVVSGSATSGGTGATVSSATTVNYQSAEAILDKFVSNAESERSVWKNADGKFNTTRLASDITAGVVLGTVGGVVTGVVIKKNQVKKGFEALHCTVGGQKVAAWGDEFSVGLRR